MCHLQMSENSQYNCQARDTYQKNAPPLRRLPTMPTAPTTTQMRLNNIQLCLTAAVDSLELLSSCSNLPFLKPISVTARSLLALVKVSRDHTLAILSLTMCHQSVRHNKNECTKLMEQIHEIIYGIIELHIKSDSGGQLPPGTLNQIGKFSG